jgi:hypothetical protein
MADLYSVARLYINFFQPSMKLMQKEREGAKVHKKYDTAKTPFQRLLDSELLEAESKNSLEKQFEKLDPVALLKEIETRQIALWSTAVFPHASKLAEGSFAAVLSDASDLDLDEVVAKARDHQSSLKARFRVSLAEPVPASKRKLPGAVYGATEVIRKYIESLPPGHVFRYQELTSIARGSMCFRVVKEMMEHGQLERLGRGLYRTPGGSSDPRVPLQITGHPTKDMRSFISSLPDGTTFMREELLQFGSSLSVAKFLTRLKKKNGIIQVRFNCYRTTGGGTSNLA